MGSGRQTPDGGATTKASDMASSGTMGICPRIGVAPSGSRTRRRHPNGARGNAGRIRGGRGAVCSSRRCSGHSRTGGASRCGDAGCGMRFAGGTGGGVSWNLPFGGASGRAAGARKNFFQSLEKWRKIFPIIEKRGQTPPDLKNHLTDRGRSGSLILVFEAAYAAEGAEKLNNASFAR